MSNRLDERSLTEGLHSLDIDALVEARHPNPFSKLGLHQTESCYVVRVLLPGASGVQMLARDSSQPLGELTQVHPTIVLEKLFRYFQFRAIVPVTSTQFDLRSRGLTLLSQHN